MASKSIPRGCAMSRPIRITLTWSESLVEQVKTYPQQSREGRTHVLDQVARVGGMADRLHASVPVDAVPVGRVEEDRYLILDATADKGLFMERDGVQYQARWVPVGGAQ